MKIPGEFIYGITQQLETPEELIQESRQFESQGAHGVCLEMQNMREEFLDVATFRRIFDSVKIRKYAAFYRKGRMETLSDDARVKYLLMAAEAGADIVDLMGDFFNPTPGELSVDDGSITRQKTLVRDIQARGAKALMSSHVLAYRPLADAVALFRAHEARGVDISKGVFSCNTPAELNESLKTTAVLHDPLKVPFILLCGGDLGKFVQRYQTILLGGCITFARLDENDVQPSVAQLRDYFDCH